MTWLHWTMMFVGGLVAWFCVGSLFALLWRRAGSMGWWGETTTDPDICRDKALEFAGDAYRNREG